ncbi:MAG: PHP domain-containing protein [Minisyncoccales bacterium]|jgi:predicted metal-dependent phosphoesterase TrpH
MLYYDLHCHTTASADSAAKLKRIIRMAKRRGLDGIAITDHNKCYKGPLEMDGIKIIPGIEITLKGSGHLLAYFIRDDIEPRRSLVETVEDVKRIGGYAVLAHPYRESHGWIKNRSDDDISVEAALEIIDGIETGNASVSCDEYKEAVDLAKRSRLVETAGSDLHMPGQAGFATVRVKEELNRDNFIDVLREGQVIVREESKAFRDEVRVGKKMITKLARKSGLIRSEFTKRLFFSLVIKNFFRFKNIQLERIDFNLKN